MSGGVHTAKDAWLALSDKGVLAEAGALMPELSQGLFLMEISLPLSEPTVLLDFQQSGTPSRTFSAFYDPKSGLSILHRQGGRVARHVLQGAFPFVHGTGRIALRFNADTGRWMLEFVVLGQEAQTLRRTTGPNPLPLRMADMHLMCTALGGIRRHSSLLWFGLTRGDAPPNAGHWVGLRSPVPTPHGPVAAGYLQVGDLVETLDHGPLPVQSLQTRYLPARGSFAPVLLRSPYFAHNYDLLVSADQMVAIVGTEVEYLFGEPSVLMPAQALVDGRTALADHRRPVTASLVIGFDRPVLMEIDGCVLALGHNGVMPELRCLKPFEVLTMQGQLGRSSGRKISNGPGF